MLNLFLCTSLNCRQHLNTKLPLGNSSSSKIRCIYLLLIRSGSFSGKKEVAKFCLLLNMHLHVLLPLEIIFFYDKKAELYIQNCLWKKQINVVVWATAQLRTYPSPNPTLTLTSYQLNVVGSGKGQVRSCSDSDIDPKWRRKVSKTP